MWPIVLVLLTATYIYEMRDGGRIWGDRLWNNEERRLFVVPTPPILSDEGWRKDLRGQIVD